MTKVGRPALDNEIRMKNRQIVELRRQLKIQATKLKRQHKVLEGWRDRALGLEYVHTLIKRRVARAMHRIDNALKAQGDDDGDS